MKIKTLYEVLKEDKFDVKLGEGNSDYMLTLNGGMGIDSINDDLIESIAKNEDIYSAAINISSLSNCVMDFISTKSCFSMIYYDIMRGSECVNYQLNEHNPIIKRIVKNKTSPYFLCFMYTNEKRVTLKRLQSNMYPDIATVANSDIVIDGYNIDSYDKLKYLKFINVKPVDIIVAVERYINDDSISKTKKEKTMDILTTIIHALPEFGEMEL